MDLASGVDLRDEVRWCKRRLIGSKIIAYVPGVPKYSPATPQTS